MKKLYIFILLSCLTVSLFGQSKENQIQKIVTDYLQPNSPGIAVLVTEGKEVLYKEASGLSDVGNSAALSTEHHFRIGSITKQFTAVAILKLVHENKIRLDASIKDYLPQASLAEDISIQQLLNHTSGLGNQSDIPSFNPAEIDREQYPAVMVEPILSSSLKFSPGTGYSYSNLGYILLGYIIENVSGMSYEAYLKKNLFMPLNLKGTGFEYLDGTNFSMSKGHSLVADTYESASFLDMKIPYAAGGLVSSLDDLSTWNSAVMNGKVIPLSYVDQLSESQVLPNGEATGYSMGWQIGNIQRVKSVKHDGIVNGFTSMEIYLPSKDIYVAVLSNCDCNRNIEIVASKITAVALGQPYPTKGMVVSEKALEEYQGTYHHQTGDINIVLHDDALMYYHKGGQKTTLLPTGENKFLLKGSLNQIEFDGDEIEKGYTLITPNRSTTWDKVAPASGYKTLSLTNSTLDEYVGKYQVPDKFVFEIFRVDDVLYGQLGNDRKEIFCYGKDKFSAQDTDALLSFSRDDKGQVNQLTVSRGIEFSAAKIK
ncbi:MAG: serine hydrolase [Lewinella sp.]